MNERFNRNGVYFNFIVGMTLVGGSIGHTCGNFIVGGLFGLGLTLFGIGLLIYLNE